MYVQFHCFSTAGVIKVIYTMIYTREMAPAPAFIVGD
jgi:hypothetical protein